MKAFFYRVIGTSILISFFGALPAFSAEPPAEQVVTGDAIPGEQKPGVKYTKGKDIDFEALVIQGQLKRPDVTVVTGNVGQGTNGLLRLRNDFLDRTAMDIGEEIR